MTVFQVIAAEEANFPVIMMCELLEVSRSGYYAWKVREPSARSQENTALAQEVAEIHAASRKTYGSPRIRSELRERGRRVSRKRVARLMRQEGIQGRRRPKFRKTTDSNHKLPVDQPGPPRHQHLRAIFVPHPVAMLVSAPLVWPRSRPVALRVLGGFGGSVGGRAQLRRYPTAHIPRSGLLAGKGPHACLVLFVDGIFHRSPAGPRFVAQAPTTDDLAIVARDVHHVLARVPAIDTRDAALPPGGL